MRLNPAAVFASLVERWNELADLLSERSALVASVGSDQLIERVGIFDREARTHWDRAVPT